MKTFMKRNFLAFSDSLRDMSGNYTDDEDGKQISSMGRRTATNKHDQRSKTAISKVIVRII